MFKQRPGLIGAFIGIVIAAALLLGFPASMGGWIQWTAVVLPAGGCVGYFIGMLGSLASRTKYNWVMVATFVFITFAGALLSYLCEFTFPQGTVFTAAMLLFFCWVFAATGSSFGALTENRAVGLIVTIGFLVALLLCFTDLANSGGIMPDRPVSFLIVVLLFLPYALRSFIELLWG